MALSLLSLLLFAAPPRCLVSRPASAHLPDAVPAGKRLAITWYEPGAKGGLEQVLSLLEPEGELVGSSKREVTPVDGASSVMGRLASNGKRLGLGWMDDASKQRTAHFRLLELNGLAASPPAALTSEFLPHGDNVAVAWNPKSGQWGTIFTGTHPTKTPGNVTHHQYFVPVRGEPGAPVRLDEAETVSVGHNAALVARGACFLTAWAAWPAQQVVLGEVCEGLPVNRSGAGSGGTPRETDGSEADVWPRRSDPVKRVTVTERAGRSVMLPSLALAGGDVLVVWVDDLPPRPPPAPSGGAAGPAPSEPMKAPPPPDREADVFFALVNLQGKVKARGSMPVNGVAQSPIARFDGTSWWLVWIESRSQKEAVLAAKLSREGQRVGELVRVSSELKGPVWASFAGATGNLLLSQPNDESCVLSWATLPAK